MMHVSRLSLCWLSALCGAASMCAGILPARADEPRTITLRGKPMREYPVEKLRSHGLDVRDVPDDRNAALVYIEAYNARKDLPPDLSDAFEEAQKGTWPQGEAGQKLAAWLNENRPALDLAKRAAAMPDYHMPVFSDGSDSLIMILLPTLSEHRQIARMLAADAALQTTQGHPDAALDNALTVGHMANHVAGGFALIEHLVGVAVRELGSQTLTRVAAAPGLDAAALQHAAAETASLSQTFPPWEQAIRNEQILSMDLIEDTFNGSVPFMNPFGEARRDKAPDTGWSKLGHRLERLFLPDRTMKRHVRTYYDDLIASAQPARDGQPARLSTDDGQRIEAIPAWNTLARMLVPAVSRSFDSSLRGAANAQRARLTLAVEAFRRESGRPPRNLNELVPSYLSIVPVDPLSGQAFVYSPGDGNAPNGLELVRRERTAAVAPGASGAENAAASEPSEWRKYVDAFVQRYRCDASQRNSAYAVLSEVEKRAADFQKRNGKRISQLRERLAAAATAVERDRLTRELAGETAAFDALFKALQARLEAIPTDAQRQAASQPADGPR